MAEDALTAGAGLVIIGFGVAALFPLSAAITFAAAPGLTTLASGRAVTAGSAAVLTAPLILGQLADAGGLRLAFGVVPVFLLMGAGSACGRDPAPASFGGVRLNPRTRSLERVNAQLRLQSGGGFLDETFTVCLEIMRPHGYCGVCKRSLERLSERS